MFHTIRFAADFSGDLETSPKHPLERFRIGKGDSLRAQIKPYVVDSDEGPLEVADLFFEDGTATRSVRFAFFQFEN